MDMSRSRYFLIVAGLFLGTSLLLAQGEHVFADEWDYSEWNYFDSVDYSSPPPQTYPNWGNETFYPLETIQDPYNVLQTQYSQPPVDYGLWDSGTIYAPASYAEIGSPDVTQSALSQAQSESMEQTVVPPENNLFTRIFGNWNLTDQPPAPPETPIVLAGNDSAILQLPPGWGVTETRTDAYTGTFQDSGGQTTSNITDVDFGGDAGSQASNQSSLNTVSGRYLNPSVYSSSGPQPYTAETGFSPKGIVMNAINYAKDFVFGGNAGNVNVTDVGPKRIEVDSGGVSYTARAIPGGAYVQAEWNIDSFFRLVKPK